MTLAFPYNLISRQKQTLLMWFSWGKAKACSLYVQQSWQIYVKAYFYNDITGVGILALFIHLSSFAEWTRAMTQGDAKTNDIPKFTWLSLLPFSIV